MSVTMVRAPETTAEVICAFASELAKPEILSSELLESIVLHAAKAYMAGQIDIVLRRRPPAA